MAEHFAGQRECTCKVVIVDDHQAVRELLGRALQALASCHYVVAGLGGTAREAVELCRRHRPDVLVVEMMLPDGNGIDVLGQVRREWPEIRVVFFTGCRQRALVAQAVELGASGYVLKSRPMQETLAAIHRVCAGGRFIDPALKMDSREGGSGKPDPAALTSREREITRLIAQGKTTKEAAAALGISAKTADKHRSNLMGKLHIHDAVGLTHYAIAAGLIRVR